jgi:hypothetical protein
MKKLMFVLVVIVIVGTMSCATALGGKVTPYQKTIPAPGSQQRSVRVGYLLADLILCTPCVIVDFATGAIYSPGPGKSEKELINKSFK